MKKEVYTVVTSPPNKLKVYNAENGALMRTITTDGTIVSSPQVIGDKAMVSVTKGQDSKSYVFNLKTGSTDKIFNLL